MRKQNVTQVLSPREKAEQKYKNARINLLVVVIFTLVNIIMAMMAEGTYFLFTAFIPYLLVLTGMLMCGKLPADWYEYDKSELDFYEPSLLYTLLFISLIIVALYFVCWLLSKKHYGFMIAALALFVIDTLFLLFNFDTSMIVDLLFHVWVLYYLGSGILNGHKLKNMPPDPVPVAYDENGMPIYQAPAYNGYAPIYPQEPASGEDGNENK